MRRGLLCLLLVGCDPGGARLRPDSGLADVEITSTPCIMGSCPAHCPVLRDTQYVVDDPDTWDNFARGFFGAWCVRCHSSTLTDSDARQGAPPGSSPQTIMHVEPDWDVEAAVRVYLTQAAPGQRSIRDNVGVYNTMPPSPPWPTCEERARLVRWIDSGAP